MLFVTLHLFTGAWIVKPVASSRGRGIYLIKNPNQVSVKSAFSYCFKIKRGPAKKAASFESGKSFWLFFGHNTVDQVNLSCILLTDILRINLGV